VKAVRAIEPIRSPGSRPVDARQARQPRRAGWERAFPALVTETQLPGRCSTGPGATRTTCSGRGTILTGRSAPAELSAGRPQCARRAAKPGSAAPDLRSRPPADRRGARSPRASPHLVARGPEPTAPATSSPPRHRPRHARRHPEPSRPLQPPPRSLNPPHPGRALRPPNAAPPPLAASNARSHRHGRSVADSRRTSNRRERGAAALARGTSPRAKRAGQRRRAAAPGYPAPRRSATPRRDPGRGRIVLAVAGAHLARAVRHARRGARRPPASPGVALTARFARSTGQRVASPAARRRT
jgi:hypothetical protein